MLEAEVKLVCVPKKLCDIDWSAEFKSRLCSKNRECDSELRHFTLNGKEGTFVFSMQYEEQLLYKYKKEKERNMICK